MLGLSKDGDGRSVLRVREARLVADAVLGTIGRWISSTTTMGA